MSSLNWSSASNRARNEKGKDLLGLVGNQAGKVGRWQNEGRWWCLFSPWDSLKSVQWAEFLLLAKVFFLTRSTPSSSRHYCNMAFYVYALPQPGEVKEKLFFSSLFFLLNLLTFINIIHLRANVLVFVPPLLFFLLSDSLWFSATKGICPQALTVVSNLWIVSFSSNISHPLPISSSALSSLSFWTSLFPHLTTQFPNRQSRINFPFPLTSRLRI